LLEEKEGWKTRGRAGTFGYMAPEMLTGKDYGLDADNWALGVTAYQLFHGDLPWESIGNDILSSMVSQPNTKKSRFSITDKDISKFKSFRFSTRLSEEGKSFIKGLLQIEPPKRLGGGGRGWGEVKEHPFFHGIDWKAMAQRSVEPPIKPNPDRANCDSIAELNDQFLDAKPKPIPPEQQRHFEGFEYGVKVAPEEKKQ